MTLYQYLNPFSAGRFATSSRTLPRLGRAWERGEKSKIQNPRVSVSTPYSCRGRNRGAHFAFPNKIPPSRPWRPLRAKARPGNAGREPSPVPHAKSATFAKDFSDQKNNPSRPLRPLREISGFTLIELMAATTVLSVILLMMVGMQDQMSKAWSNSNRRTDATREARAACRLMARDFSYLLVRHTNRTRQAMRSSSVTNSMVPFCYYSGSGTSALSMPSSWARGSAYLFGIVPRKKSSTNDSDFALVGYYIAQSTNTNANGFQSVSWNLHRYYKTSNAAISAFTNWIGTNSPANLFPSISPTITATNPVADDILARNACNLQIRVLIATNSANGLISNFNYGSNAANGIYLGNKIHVELTCYPEESAQKLTDMSSWTNTNNLQKLARTFEFNVDLPANED